MKYILLVTALMVASSTHGQNRVSENGPKNNFRVDLFYSLDTNLSGDIELSDEIGYRTEYDRNNFTTGLTVVYFLSNNFALRSGASYANRDFSGIFYCNVCDFTGSGPQQEKINLRFVQVPVALRLYPYNNKISIFGELGIRNQIMVGSDKPDTYGVTDQVQGNTYSLSGTLGAGIAYNFTHGFSTALSANYANGFTQIFKDADYSYKTLGIQLTLSIEL